MLLICSKVDTIAVALDIALSGPAGKIPHLIRVEFPWLVTFITRTCQIIKQLKRKVNGIMIPRHSILTKKTARIVSITKSLHTILHPYLTGINLQLFSYQLSQLMEMRFQIWVTNIYGHINSDETNIKICKQKIKRYDKSCQSAKDQDRNISTVHCSYPRQ